MQHVLLFHPLQVEKAERLAVPAHALLHEDGARSRAVDDDYQGDEQHGNGQYDQREQRQNDVLRPAHSPVSAPRTLQ